MRLRPAALALAFLALCCLGALWSGLRAHRAPEAAKAPPWQAAAVPARAHKPDPAAMDAGQKGASGAGVLVFDGENWWREEKKNGRVIRKRLIDSPAAGNK